VALSRVKTLDGLYLNNFAKRKLTTSDDVKEEMDRLRQDAKLESPFLSIMSNDNVLKFILLNARSAKLHFQDICKHPLVQAADVVCLTETHYPFTQTKNFQIPNFEMSSLPCTDKCHRCLARINVMVCTSTLTLMLHQWSVRSLVWNV